MIGSLADRYERRALVAAGGQVGLWGGLVLYALVPTSLGSRLLVPGLVMTVAFGALVWLTLHRPWDAAIDTDRRLVGNYGRWLIWPPGLIAGLTLWVANAYRGAYADAKAHIREQAAIAEDLVRRMLYGLDEAWAADSYGALLVSGPTAFATIGVPLAALGLLWVFLPR